QRGVRVSGVDGELLWRYLNEVLPTDPRKRPRAVRPPGGREAIPVADLGDALADPRALYAGALRAEGSPREALRPLTVFALWLAARHAVGHGGIEADLRWLTSTRPVGGGSGWPKPAGYLDLGSPRTSAQSRCADHRRVAADIAEQHWLPRGRLLDAVAALYPHRRAVARLAALLRFPVLALAVVVLFMINQDAARWAAVVLLSLAVLGFVAPAMGEHGECLDGWWHVSPWHSRPFTRQCTQALGHADAAPTAGVLSLMTGWSLATGLAVQILWDDRPVTAPLGRIRRVRGGRP